MTTIAGAALENADGFLRLKQINDTLEQRVLERTQAAEDRARQLTVSNEQLLATEDNLKRAIVQANTANEAKSRFLATISHEIRTPLNGILGMTCLASKATEDSRLIGYLNSVELSGQSLLTLINDLLDFSKLEAGKMELEQIPTDLSQVAGEVCRLLAASAWQKNLELVCDLDPFLPRTVIGDPSRIRQILMNLVGNAIKFTETGHICLAIRTVEESSRSSTIQFTVQDSGIGIAHEHIDKVFESFSQSDSSMTRRYGGTGLGLAICRELAEGMEGTIDVESEFGNGSTFTVTLVMPTVNQDRLVEPIAIFPPPQIMIIDPLPASQHAIANALKPVQAKTMACSPNPADTSPSTIDTMLESELDLIICSGEIPDQVWNHCSTTKTPTLWIRSGTSTASVPAVPWLTEIRSPAMCPEILAAAAEMLQYPRRQVSDDDAPVPAIAPKNETIIERSPEPTETFNEPVSTDPPSRTRSPRILVAEDGVINREVISGILEMQAYVAVLAKDGVEAVEIADQEEFDICLMDVDMPRMDGIEATRMIRMRDIPTGARRFPIVAMTAHSDDQIWASCKEAGMDAYISKPIQPEKLFETIQALCNETAPPITTPV
ncbi:ATP-binding protein [Roseimaritima multifibrata]|uniref:ATP-binding protein n=1 Tax=Roseimaritima multifibrata TaxID=1930274 RepID=UPI003704AAD0